MEYSTTKKELKFRHRENDFLSFESRWSSCSIIGDLENSYKTNYNLEKQLLKTGKNVETDLKVFKHLKNFLKFVKFINVWGIDPKKVTEFLMIELASYLGIARVHNYEAKELEYFDKH